LQLQKLELFLIYPENKIQDRQYLKKKAQDIFNTRQSGL